MRNPFKACSCTHNQSSNEDHNINARMSSEPKPIVGRTSRSIDNDDRPLNNGRQSDLEAHPVVQSGSAANNGAVVDDETVSRVLRNTRGQAGPVVQIKGDEQAVYGGYGLSDPRSSFSSQRSHGRKSIDRPNKSSEKPRRSIDRNAISPVVASRSSIDDRLNSSSARRSIDDHQGMNGNTIRHVNNDNNSFSVPRRSIDNTAGSGDNYGEGASAAAAVAAGAVAARKEHKTATPNYHSAGTSRDTNGTAVGGIPTLPQIPQSPQNEEPDAFASNYRYDQPSADLGAVKTQTQPQFGERDIPRSSAATSYSTGNAGVTSNRPLVEETASSGRDLRNDGQTRSGNNIDKLAAVQDGAMPVVDYEKPHDTRVDRAPVLDNRKGVPLGDESYVTEQRNSDLGWPLTQADEPPDTEHHHGTRDVYSTGPLATALAEKYAEPDKYSRTVHIHKEEADVKPAVTHERVQVHVHHEITEEITRDIHHHDVRVHIQPILDRKTLPDRHWVEDDNGELVEISAQMAEILKLEDGYQEPERYELKTDWRGNKTMNKLTRDAIVA